jgi:FixJ family two-component response regulator
LSPKRSWQQDSKGKISGLQSGSYAGRAVIESLAQSIDVLSLAIIFRNILPACPVLARNLDIPWRETLVFTETFWPLTVVRRWDTEAKEGTPMSGDPTVFVLGDAACVPTGVVQLLVSAELRVRVAPSIEEFLRDYEPGQPGFVVIQASHTLVGVALQERLIALGHKVPIIIVSVASDVPSAIRAIKLGAVSVLELPVDRDVLLDVAKEAIVKDMASRRANAHTAEMRRRLASLTRREREVLNLLLLGKANKEVAASLALSEKTVEIHRAHVLRKLHAPNLTVLVRMVLTIGASETIGAEMYDRLLDLV